MLFSRLVLASASPRRRELITLLDLPEVLIEASLYEEGCEVFVDANTWAMNHAKGKALERAAFHQGEGDWILGVDTIGDLNGQLLEKPKDKAEAKAMWQAMQGREHRILSALYLYHSGTQKSFERIVESRVQFHSMNEAEIEAYLETMEWEDKSGAYAIQGRAAKHVKAIHGDFYNIVGLPVAALYEMIQSAIKA